MPSPSKNNKSNNNKPGFVTELNAKVKMLEETIIELKKRNSDLEERVTILESKSKVSERVNDELRSEADRLDQDGRRSNLIIKHVFVN